MSEAPTRNYTLRPYQGEDVEFFKKWHKIIIGDEMGLGKTVSTIACIQSKVRMPVLIVTPSHLKYNWRQELAEKANRFDVHILQGRKVYQLPTNEIYIINYDILEAWLPYFEQIIKPNFMIADEAHMLKNRTTKRSMAFKQLADSAKYCILLSGTIMEQEVQELWHPLHILNPSYFTSFLNFVKTFTYPKKGRWGWKYHGCRNKKKLQKLLDDYMIRHTKAEVLTELPPKIYSDLYLNCDLTEYTKIENDFIEWLRLTEGNAKANKAKKAEKIGRMIRLRQEAGKAKLPQIIDYIKNFIATGKKIVVYGWFIENITALSKAFPTAAVVKGGMDGSAKNHQVTQFMDDPKCMVFIGNLKASGTGLNLTVSDTVLTLEPDWNPSIVDQADDRIHRLTSTHTQFNIIRAKAMETIDVHLYEVLDSKRKLCKSVIDGQESGASLNVAEAVLDKYRR